MATCEGSNAATSFPLTSKSTALCLLPPRHLWARIDRLRSLYDKAYEKWPPHVNLVYPFLDADSLPTAVDAITGTIQTSGHGPFHLSLAGTGVFRHKHGNTVYLRESDEQRMAQLRERILRSLAQGDKVGDYQMHMTIAQTEDAESSLHGILVNKVSLLPPVEWDVDQVCVLVRQQTGEMRLWGTISLVDGSVTVHPQPVAFYHKAVETGAEDERVHCAVPFYFHDEYHLWMPHRSFDTEEVPKRISVASYNVLAEFDWPPSQARYPLLVKNMFSRSGSADVLILQEVTDDFLSYLLGDERIRETYTFSSHGPPDQPDIEPLPSILNMVILSKLAFECEVVSLHRKHKVFLVVKFRHVGKQVAEHLHPLIMAAVHLSRGLTDGSVAARKSEMQQIMGHLTKNYADCPWVLAGDFNTTTSSYTIRQTLAKKAISSQTVGYLKDIETLLDTYSLEDAWVASRFEAKSDVELEFDELTADSDVLEGERGATYDPTVNEIAASLVGNGDVRPQRYDRILVRKADYLDIVSFNRFGLFKERLGDDNSETYASDHWGVRCFLRVGVSQKTVRDGHEARELVVPVVLKKASGRLAEHKSVERCLEELHVMPGQQEVKLRQEALEILQEVLVGSESNAAAEDSPRKTRPGLVVVPVGSYPLGVWTFDSDIDCLCIGPFSSRTFFALATQRLRKDQRVKILRRVRAAMGTMLELEIAGIKVDLQYGSASFVAQHWPYVLRTPATDPIWTLSAPTLMKLQSIRDLDYLRRSIPDLSGFQTAHRLIRTWAKSRGIYSAKFGYLSGISVSMLLAPVCKLLARGSGTTSVSDILTTFFAHYASFDWKNKIVFDPFFHKDRLPYTRTAREPLAVLRYYPPSLNACQAASVPSVRAMADEFRKADAALSGDGPTWQRFLGGGADNFLAAYKKYIKLEVHFWGVSLAKGASFVGWLESRCVSLLVDVSRRAPDLDARIWPGRFVEANEAGADEGRDYRGCYLVGLAPLVADTDRETLGAQVGALQAALGRFEETVRGDDRFFDAKSSWMSAAVVTRADLEAGGGLVPDKRAWGEYTPGEDESDEEEEEEEEDEDEREEDHEGLADELSGLRVKKHGKKAAPATAAPKLATGKKFRTAADVMHRLRWDPGFDSGDFIIGYEDRFLGPRERELDAWKTEQTDEEFIPQHRILYFKRKADKVVVWDRRARKDEVFGSGL